MVVVVVAPGSIQAAGGPAPLAVTVVNPMEIKDSTSSGGGWIRVPVIRGIHGTGVAGGRSGLWAAQSRTAGCDGLGICDYT